MKALLVAAGATMLLTSCATTAPDDTRQIAAATTAANGMPIVAHSYMEWAASGDLFEITSSQVALQRSNNGAVRSFAEMLITDHTRMNREMLSAASTAGLPPPPQAMLRRHGEMLQRLKRAAPRDFDAAYRNEQIAAHQEALMLHQTYGAQGSVPSLRAVANAATPVIQAHLGHAQSLSVLAAAAVPTSSVERAAGARGSRRVTYFAIDP